MNRSSASNASARYATVRERNAVLDHCPVDRMMQQDLNTGRYSSNRAQVKGMNVANAPTSKQPTEAGIVAEGLSLQVREVLMNIENLRSYHWTKIESLEGMLECGDLQAHPSCRQFSQTDLRCSCRTAQWFHLVSSTSMRRRLRSQGGPCMRRFLLRERRLHNSDARCHISRRPNV